MKLSTIYLATVLSITATAPAQLIIGDNYNVTGSGTGFALGSGVNSGINPPTTRLTGSAADGLSYLKIGSRANNLHSVNSSGKLQVNAGTATVRLGLSLDGTTAFDFGPAMNTASATPLNPLAYDVTISMANNSADNQRFSFAMATVEGQTGDWDFGIQLYRTSGSDFYTIQRRINAESSGATVINNAMGTTAAGTFGSEINFLMRVTDAGADSFESRVQVSMDGGNSFFYDTQTDDLLPNGWRLDGESRYFIMDIAQNAGIVTYDNFSVTMVPEPSTFALAGLGGLALVWLRRQHRK